MKFLLLCLICFHFSAQAQVVKAIDIATYMAVKNVTSPPDPNDLIAGKCGDWQEYNKEAECFDEKVYKVIENGSGMDEMFAEGLTTKHCDVSTKDFGKFCFQNTLVKEDAAGANRLMMEYLCTDQRLDAKITIAFGACTKGQEIKTEEMSCYCQFIRGQEKNGLAFHCTDNGN